MEHSRALAALLESQADLQSAVKKLIEKIEQDAKERRVPREVLTTYWLPTW